jgi:hypothetical protein
MLTPRDFLTPEIHGAWLQEYEQMRAFRNVVSKRRPTPEEVGTLQVNKAWERFYAAVLFQGDD